MVLVVLDDLYIHHGRPFFILPEDTENIFDFPGDLPAIASRSGEAGGYRQIKTSQSAERGRFFVVGISKTHGDLDKLV
ncbi:MAG: hypothetical protein PVH02_12020 [Desulfobacteraceae bacterium]